MKIISFVGWSKSGKTAIIEWLVRELKRRELRVVVVKHIHKPIFEVDRKGKDTWRLFNAGADAVMGVSSRRFYLLSRTQNTLPLEKLCGVLEWIYNKVDFIFFTDGDCAPVKDWIDKMLEVFNRDAKIGAVGGEIYTLRVDPNNLVEIYCEAFGFNRVSWRCGNLEEGYYPAQGNMPTQVCGHRSYFFVTADVAYRKEAVEDAERKFWELPTGEDIDFGIRVRKKGWKFYFLPSASVQHMHRANLKALLRVWKSYAAAHAPLLDAHATNHMEIVLQFIGNYPKHPIITLPSFVKGFIYIGNFHLMHLWAALFILTFITQWFWPLSVGLRLSSWIFFIFTVEITAKLQRGWSNSSDQRNIFFKTFFIREVKPCFPIAYRFASAKSVYFSLAGNRVDGGLSGNIFCINSRTISVIQLFFSSGNRADF